MQGLGANPAKSETPDSVSVVVVVSALQLSALSEGAGPKNTWRNRDSPPSVPSAQSQSKRSVAGGTP